MTNKKFWLGMLILVLAFSMTVVGCDDGSTDNKTIDSKFRGKWEMESFLYSGTTYTLPCTFMGMQINTGGIEIGEKTYKNYLNGNLSQSISDLYSDGNSLIHASGQVVLTINISGTNAEFVSSLETDYCKKVTKFSWE